MSEETIVHLNMLLMYDLLSYSKKALSTSSSKMRKQIFKCFEREHLICSLLVRYLNCFSWIRNTAKQIAQASASTLQKTVHQKAALSPISSEKKSYEISLRNTPRETLHIFVDLTTLECKISKRDKAVLIMIGRGRISQRILREKSQQKLTAHAQDIFRANFSHFADFVLTGDLALRLVIKTCL